MEKVKKLLFIGIIVLSQTLLLHAQEQKINVSKAPKNLTGLFTFIQEKYGYRFFYNNEMVAADQKVELKSNEYLISDLLKELSEKTGLSFKLRENNLIVVEDTSSATITPGVITGTVKDAATGETIPGVSIVTVGSSEGMATDMDGKFSIKVKNMNDMISISFVGYTTQIIPIKGKTSFEISLAQNVTKVEEVIVTALNINRSKVSLGYSVSTVDGKDLNKAKENNVINSLAGTVAGLQISKAATGVDGSTRVILRGVSSINGDNRPLVVVDGIPVDAGYSGGSRWGGTDGGDALSDINSEDIESMSILKGAGAAAAYGSRGANGVILITTKKGKLKKGLGISLSSSLSVENPMLYPEFQNSYGHGAFGTYPTSLPDVGMPWAWSYGPKMDGQTLPNYWGGTSSYSPQPNNYKDFFQTGTSMVNSIAMESGNDVSTVRASVTSQKSNGIVPLNDLDRQTINLRGFTKMKDVVELDAKVTYMHSKVSGRPEVAEGYNNPGYMLSIMPRNMVNSELNAHQTDANGNELLWTTDGYTTNPYWQLYNNANNDEKNRIQGVMSAKIIFDPHLNLLIRSGMDLTNRGAHSHTAKGSKAAGINGKINNSLGNSVEWNSDFLLSFDPKKESDIKYTASLGGNYRYNTDKGLSQWGTNLRINDYYAISNAATYGTDEWFSEKQVYSLYGLATGTYKNWLFLDFTLRNDWSSTLPVNNNSYLYYSSNLSFLFTDAFHLNSLVLTTGKLRASVSKVGNDTSPYQTSKYYTVNQTQLPYPMGSFSDVLASYDLQPEITKSWELGTSLNFFKNLLNLDLTYYNNISENQIMDIPLPPASGYSSARTNAASLSNKGLEAQLDVAAIKKDNFTWNIVGTWSKNRSKVERLYGNMESIILDEIWHATIQARPGMEYGEIYTTDFKRDSYGRKLVDNQGYVIKGDYKAVGNMNPDWIGGLSNNFKYKDFSLTLLVDIRKGGDVYSMGNAYRNLFGTSVASVQGREEWYSTHNPENGYVTPLPGVDPKGYVEDGINENTGQKNTVPIDPLYRFYNIWAKEIGIENVMDATNVRMREASLGYSLPRRILNRTFFTDVQISLVGRNLFFFYNAMKDIDPESGYSSGNTGGGFEHCAIPTTRSLGFNLKVNF
jgi:TonB-linked SusC/RagA family outer membrane protein